MSYSWPRAMFLVLFFNALLLGIGNLHRLTHCGFAVAGRCHRRLSPSKSKSPSLSQVTVANDEVAQRRCHSKQHSGQGRTLKLIVNCIMKLIDLIFYK
jgi:hypothetical protein